MRYCKFFSLAISGVVHWMQNRRFYTTAVCGVWSEEREKRRRHCQWHASHLRLKGRKTRQKTGGTNSEGIREVLGISTVANPSWIFCIVLVQEFFGFSYFGISKADLLMMPFGYANETYFLRLISERSCILSLHLVFPFSYSHYSHLPKGRDRFRAARAASILR